jgi:putative transposase
MQRQSNHKMYHYQLKPTPEPEWTRDRVLMGGGHVYHAALGERREAYRMRGICVTYYQQKAELPGRKEALPEYREVASPLLQDVVRMSSCGSTVPSTRSSAA